MLIKLDNRQECSNSGVHPGLLAGIYGSKELGAFSVVLSGGYEDDEDHGDTLYVRSSCHATLRAHKSNSTYTGSGGRDTDGNVSWNRLD